MASICRETRNKKTLYRVQFWDKDGKRRSIRLTGLNRKAVDAIAVRIDYLVSASVAGTPLDIATTEWLATVGKELADKLADAGLTPKRESATLKAFLDAYIESRGDAKPNTIRNLKNSRERLVAYFGADRELHAIKPGEADEWRQAMVNDKFATATISKAVKHAKQFFKLATRKGLVRSNPFAELKAGGERNNARLCFVDRPTIAKLIDAAPDVEWRLIIALARYGGLRTPSEQLELKWSDINWAENRMTVTARKTEHQGKGERMVPLFPELRLHLDAAYHAAAEGAVYCITRYRQANCNLRTQFLRIIQRAGIEPWERLFQNLRASRETELTDKFPIHVVTGWLGNTPAVADRHYLQTIEAHFDQAIAGEVVQGVVQQTAAKAGKVVQTANSAVENVIENLTESETLQAVATNCDLITHFTQTTQIPPRGVEPRFSD